MNLIGLFFDFISFYFPCLIMLCLYARLYSICQRHVRSIKSMTKMRTFIGSSDQFEEIEDGIAHRNEVAIRNSKKSTNQIRKKNVPMNEIVNCRKQEYLHGNVQHQNQHHQQQSHVSEHKAAITLGIIMGTFLSNLVKFYHKKNPFLILLFGFSPPSFFVSNSYPNSSLLDAILLYEHSGGIL